MKTFLPSLKRMTGTVIGICQKLNVYVKSSWNSKKEIVPVKYITNTKINMKPHFYVKSPKRGFPFRAERRMLMKNETVGDVMDFVTDEATIKENK